MLLAARQQKKQEKKHEFKKDAMPLESGKEPDRIGSGDKGIWRGDARQRH